MKINTKIGKESAISFSGMGIGQILRYLFTTFLARGVGVELVGIYSISNAITRIFEVIGKMGLDQGVLRAINRQDKNLDKVRIILSALKMGLFSSLFFMCIQILISNWLVINLFPKSSILNQVIIIHAFSLPLYIIIHIASHSIQAYKILKYKIIVNEILNPLILLLSMLFIYLCVSVKHAITFPVIIASFFCLLAINVFLKKITTVSIFSINKGKFNQRLLTYSLPIMFISILGTVLHWTDTFMLGYYTDTFTVGLYHPAARTAGMIRMILIAFSGIYGPIIAEMYLKKQSVEMNHLFKLVTRWVMTFSIPFLILILIYSKKIMLIFGIDFIEGHSILILLALAAFIQAVFGIGGTTLNMTGFPKINLLNTFIGFSINIILNIILIPIAGGFGAAMATLITLTTIAIMRVFQNWKFLSMIPWNKKLLKPIIAGILTISISLIVKPYLMPLHTIFTMISAICMIFSTYFFLLWLFGLDDDDKELKEGVFVRIHNIKYLIKN